MENQFLRCSGKVESRYENRVFVDPSRRDEYGMPELQVDFSYSAKDEASFSRCMPVFCMLLRRCSYA